AEGIGGNAQARIPPQQGGVAPGIHAVLAHDEGLIAAEEDAGLAGLRTDGVPLRVRDPLQPGVEATSRREAGPGLTERGRVAVMFPLRPLPPRQMAVRFGERA